MSGQSGGEAINAPSDALDGRAAADDAWLCYVGNRDDEAFARVVRAYHGLVYSVCRRCFGGHEGVEDVVQETFLKLALHADKIDRNLSGWLHRCALNTARDAVRRSRTRRRHETNSARNHSAVNRNGRLAADLDEAIQTLSGPDQTLIVEHFIVGTPQTELAERLGITPSAVSKRITAALARLRTKLPAACFAAVGSSVATILADDVAAAPSAAEGLVSSVLAANRRSGLPWLHWLGLSHSPKALSLTTIGAGLLATTILACVVLWGNDLLRAITQGPTVVSRGALGIVGGHAGDSFGHAMAASGNHLLIGAPHDKTAGREAGAFYAFRRERGEWVQQQKVPRPGPDGQTFSNFGGAIALSGDSAAIGHSGPWFVRKVDLKGKEVVTEVPPASVHLYRHRQGRWRRTTVLRAKGSGAYGSSLALSSDHLLVGDAYDDQQAENAGVVYTYRRVDDDWLPKDKILPPPDQPRLGFGWHLALQGVEAAISASGDSTARPGAGAVYVYRFSDGRWHALQKLSERSPERGSGFGESVAMDARTLVVGAACRAAEQKSVGRVFVFEKEGDAWREKQVLTAPDGSVGDEYGYAVAVRDDVIIVGARFADIKETHTRDCGAAYVYCRRWGEWTLSRVFHPTSSEPGVALGDSAAIGDAGLIVGCGGGYQKLLTERQAERLIKQLTAGRFPRIPTIRDKPGRAFMFDVVR